MDDAVKRVAVLVIAATNQPVYRHYLAGYWTDLIRYTETELPHIDVYLLVEHGHDRRLYAQVKDHVIEDPIGDFDHLLPRHLQRLGTPSVLHKTIHALDVLGSDYDLFFRTNLSSMIRVTAFDGFVQSRAHIGYSGCWVWADTLRDQLVAADLVGPDQVIRHLSELDRYPGNSFISGSGFFLDTAQAARLVTCRGDLAYGLPDDVAIGLMLEHHEVLRGFSERIESTMLIAEMFDRIEHSSAAHIRLENFPVERAQALWRYLAKSESWR